MKKTILALFSLLLANIPMQAQEKVETILVENLSEYLKQNNISEFYFEKFGEVLKNHHITYTPNEKWIVESSDLCSVAGGKAAFATAEGLALVFIPGFGWAVSLGLGVVEQLIFD